MGLLGIGPQTLPEWIRKPVGLLFVPHVRYRTISVLLLLVYVPLFCAFVPGWTDDYWDHAAAVRALADNLLTPAHPLFIGPYSGDRGFNPYLLMLAVISRETGASPFLVMKLGAAFNIVLLFAGLNLFMSQYFEDRRVATWVLLCFLFFWTTRGATLREFAYYPSFFVTSCTFLFWYLLVQFLQRGRIIVFLFALVVGLTLWLSHQLQGAMAVGTGMLLAYFETDGTLAKRGVMVALLPALIVGLGELWPYFSSLRYTLGNFAHAGYNERGMTWEGGLKFYIYILGPNVLAITLALAGRASTRFERFIRSSVMLLGLAWAVLFLVRSQYATIFLVNTGSMAAIWVGLALAAGSEATQSFRTRYIPWQWFRRIILVVLCLAMLLQVKYTLGWLRQFYWLETGAQYQEMIREYGILHRWIGPHDVVLSDKWSSWQLPTFVGRIISRPEGHQLDYNVSRPDLEARAADLEAFFAPGASVEHRKGIIRKYQVQFLLINRVATPDRDPASFAELGETVFSSGRLTLLRVSEGSAPDPVRSSQKLSS